jgi:hypothetical protein
MSILPVLGSSKGAPFGAAELPVAFDPRAKVGGLMVQPVGFADGIARGFDDIQPGLILFGPRHEVGLLAVVDPIEQTEASRRVVNVGVGIEIAVWRLADRMNQAKPVTQVGNSRDSSVSSSSASSKQW